MDLGFFTLVFYVLAALLLAAVSYGFAWLLRSKYTPVTIQGSSISMIPMFGGAGLLVLSTCCILPYSCADVEAERVDAIDQFKAQREAERPSGQWHYGRLYPDRNVSLNGGLFEAPAQIQATGHELRFTIRWRENGTMDRTTSFSGNLGKNKTNRLYQGTWYTANTNREGEWTLFEVDDGYYSGWITDKGNDEPKPFYLRKER